MRILVLEDNLEMGRALQFTLEDEGYQVSLAGSAFEAVTLASQLAFDLVISDIRMEGMDGLEALERMKLDNPDASTMVITGYSSEADSLRALQLGVGDYLRKPFTMEELLERVRRLLADRQTLDFQSVAVWAVNELARARGLEPAEDLAVALQALGAPFGALAGPQDVSPEARSRGLLNLGRALEQAGDLDNAERAYQLVEGGGALSLARLWRRRGDFARVRELLREARDFADGPQARAEVDLWGGLYLVGGPFHEEAVAMLGEAQQSLLALGQLGQAACAFLAAAAWLPPAPVDSALKTLLAHPAEMSAAAAWLLPSLQELKRRRGSSELLEQVLGEPRTVLRVYSTGAFEVFLGDERLDESVWKGQKNKFLLAYLLGTGGRPVPDDRVVEEFWPGGSLGGKRNLNNVLSILRRGLNGLEYFARSGGLLSLSSLPRWHDVEEIDDCLRAGDRASLQRASSLYRGPYLEGCYMEFALAQRTRLEGAMAQGLWKLAGMLEPREALEQLQRLHEVDPCHQEGYRLAMQLSLGLGRPEEAVRCYKRCEKMLAQELGMEPSLELVELFQRARLSL